MGKHRIAIDDGLSYYRPLLEREGYDVLNLGKDGARDAEAILLSGMDDDFMGIRTRIADAFVFDVDGRQPEEVLYDLRKHFSIKEDNMSGPS